MAAQAGGGKPVVDHQGNVTLNGEAIGSLAIVDFPKPYQLTKVAGTMFVPGAAVGTAAPQAAGALTTVAQGALEQSNVDSISEMVQMVEASRFLRVANGWCVTMTIWRPRRLTNWPGCSGAGLPLHHSRNLEKE